MRAGLDQPVVLELLLPAVLAMAVVVWPGGPRADRRLRALFVRPGGGAVGRPRDSNVLPALAPDLLMELVACGLRAGLSVSDAVGCAAEASVTTAAEPDGTGRPGGSAGRRAAAQTSGRGRWRLRPGRRPPNVHPSSFLVEVVARLRVGVPVQQAWARPPPELAALAKAMVLAELSGAPAAAVVARAAADSRAGKREQVELAAARLGVRLVLPLGLAVLPGFVLLAVVPIVLGLASSVLQLGD